MFKLDDNFLNELGLGALPPADKNKMLAHIYETLEMRVGMRLAEKMSNEQLDEFEAYINKNDEAGALKWLETNFPNYKEVVAEELEKLKSEIKQVAPQIVQQAIDNASAQGSVLTPQPTAPVTPSYQQPVPQQQPAGYAQPAPVPAPQYPQSTAPYQQPNDGFQPQSSQQYTAPMTPPAQSTSTNDMYSAQQPVENYGQPVAPQPQFAQAPMMSEPQQTSNFTQSAPSYQQPPSGYQPQYQQPPLPTLPQTQTNASDPSTSNTYQNQPAPNYQQPTNVYQPPSNPAA